MGNACAGRQQWLSLATGACFALSLSSTAFAYSNAAYDQGLYLYKQGCYEKSLEYLTKAVIAAPSDALVHYYLASAYARLGKHKEAKQEYFACYCLDPNGVTGQYCRTALRVYGEPVPGDKLDSRLAGDKQVEQAVSQIKREAQLQKQSNDNVANQGSLTAGRIGEEEAARIKSAANRRLNSRSTYLTPAEFFNRDTEDPNLVMARAEEGARLARLSAKQKADQYEEWSRAQQKSVDEIAGNLESQLKSSSAAGGAHLKAEGTGFYVRFYGNKREAPLPDVHRSVARIATFGAEQAKDDKPLDNSENHDTER